MLDDNLNLYMIEVNTNPCLEMSCPLLARIIPELLDNVFRIVLDPLFPSPDLLHNKKCSFNEIPQTYKFHLVFDDVLEQPYLVKMLSKLTGIAEEVESDAESELEEDTGGASGSTEVASTTARTSNP